MKKFETAVSAMLDDTKIALGLDRLQARWQNEKEYEDWKDYENVMKTWLTNHKDFTFVKGHKRPFGFSATYKTSEVVQIGMKIKGKHFNLFAKY